MTPRLVFPCIFVSLILCVGGETSTESSSDLILDLSHSLDDGKTFTHRQTLRFSSSSIKSGVKTSVPYSPEPAIRDSIRRLCDSHGLLRFRASIGSETRHSVSDPCILIQNDFKEAVSLALDLKSSHVWESPSNHISPRITQALEAFSSYPKSLALAPAGHCGLYSKLEQEKLAKKRGDTKENASFFSKYWMYIVPS
ncbi:Uncharacterized protein FKW44_019029 [Caligus rogercresseyi]|uniref:Uncharacterized protein n=1 Tax=Caligus rogercresseyi TaxID=217165 RepID=A0A7T8JY59_CALRO|nr:Uncharacterized protein FKW44_019029 [Caligus rogercresseyi]